VWFLRNIAQAGEPSIAIRQQANMRVEKKPIPRKSFVIHTKIMFRRPNIQKTALHRGGFLVIMVL